MIPRVFLVVAITEGLLAEKHRGEQSRSPLIVAMRAAASGDRERFERVVSKHVPEEFQPYVRALCEQTVFAELEHRALLATNPSKSKRPHGFNTWHVEIRHMLELLLGPREGEAREFT